MEEIKLAPVDRDLRDMNPLCQRLAVLDGLCCPSDAAGSYQAWGFPWDHRYLRAEYWNSQAYDVYVARARAALANYSKRHRPEDLSELM